MIKASVSWHYYINIQKLLADFGSIRLLVRSFPTGSTSRSLLQLSGSDIFLKFHHKYWILIRLIPLLLLLLPLMMMMMIRKSTNRVYTVYPKKYAHGFVVFCFVVVMQSFIMNSHEVFIHIHQGCFAGTGEIVRLPQCQWSKPDGYGKISQCITTTKHSKAKTVCIFLGIYCSL